MEIGSDFWDNDGFRGNYIPRLNCEENESRRYFISGRTALDYIIRDIQFKFQADSVLLPSYCCHTMIEPFLRNKFIIRFYDVHKVEQKGLVAEGIKQHDKEIVYLVQYFGFSKVYFDMDTISDTRLIIHDKTHSFLDESISYQFGYSFVSYRKWMYLTGIAEAKSMEGAFAILNEEKNHNNYISLREKAAMKKTDYMKKHTNSKEYLDIYNQAELMLEKDYLGYKADSNSLEEFNCIDLSKISAIRRRNAMYLIWRLRQVKSIDLVFDNVNDRDVPLMVPILVSQEQREELRDYLRRNHVYCPVHWPFSKMHNQISARAKAIYDTELSLVCDQRYGVEDMEREVELIERFYNGYKE